MPITFEWLRKNFAFIEKIFFFIFLSALLYAVWAHQWFHTGDGPAHLYCANVLNKLVTDAYSPFQRYFELNIQPVPNSLVQVLLAVLLAFFNAATANKIIVSLVILIFCFGYLKLTRIISGASKFFPLLFVAFIFCIPLKTGFYNFLAGLGIMMAAFSQYLESYSTVNLKKYVYFALLVLLLWFTHFFGFSLLLLAVFIHQFFFKLTESVRAKNYSEFFRNAVYWLITFIPSIILSLLFAGHAAGANVIRFAEVDALNEGLFSAVTLRNYFTDKELTILNWFFGALLLPLIFWLFSRNKKANPNLSFVLVFLLVLLLMYYLLPYEFLAGGMINLRMAYVLFIFLAVFSESLTMNVYCRALKLAAGCMITWYSITNQVKESAFYSREIEDLQKSLSVLHHGAIVLPLNYSDYIFQFNYALYLSCNDKDITVLDNLEADSPNGLVRWNDRAWNTNLLGNYLTSPRPELNIAAYENEKKVRLYYVLRWRWNENIKDAATLRTNNVLDSLFKKIYVSEREYAEVFLRK